MFEGTQQYQPEQPGLSGARLSRRRFGVVTISLSLTALAAACSQKAPQGYTNILDEDLGTSVLEVPVDEPTLPTGTLRMYINSGLIEQRQVFPSDLSAEDGTFRARLVLTRLPAGIVLEAAVGDNGLTPRSRKSAGATLDSLNTGETNIASFSWRNWNIETFNLNDLSNMDVRNMKNKTLSFNFWLTN